MQAATCGRCRSELGEAGRVCRHCKMDDVWVAWEIRLFRVETRAMEAGAYVSAEDALRQVPLFHYCSALSRAYAQSTHFSLASQSCSICVDDTSQQHLPKS